MTTDGSPEINALEKLLSTCVVDVYRDQKLNGTGFFVAPWRVLTCAHVIRDASTIGLKWQGRSLTVRSTQKLPPAGEPGRWPPPDVALLEIERDPAIRSHPCVLLDRGKTRPGPSPDTFRLAAMALGGHTAPDAIGRTSPQLTADGIHRESGFELVRLKGGPIDKGNSGGPLMNERSLGVSLIVQSALNDKTGGFGVEVDAFVDDLDGLWKANQAFHAERPEWPEAAAKDLMAPLVSQGLAIWGADDFALGRGTQISDEADADANDIVDILTLRLGRLPNLQHRYAALTDEYLRWLNEPEQRKRNEARFRVFWIEAPSAFKRGSGRLACLARTSGGNVEHPRAVCDASNDIAIWRDALLRCLDIPGSWRRPVVTVDLGNLDLSASELDKFRGVFRAAQQRSGEDDDPFPRLVVCGTTDQRRAFVQRLSQVVDLRAVHHTGRDAPTIPREDGGTLAVVLERDESGEDPRTYIRGMPMTSRRLFGRTKELDLLDKAWTSGSTRVVSVIASGGAGKSALVNTWLERMLSIRKESPDDPNRRKDPNVYDRAFAWSFYSQGTKDNLVSADPFINSALLWLGAEDAQIRQRPFLKGDHLADRIMEQGRFLLVMDGLEPLQHPPNADNGGAFTDESVYALLDGLARRRWPGLCVVTSRVPLMALERFRRAQPAAYVEHQLDQLTPVAAASLLEHLGVHGTFDERNDAAKEVGRHALAVTLLGNYLREWHGGDVRARAMLDQLTTEPQQGGHARRIMSSYVRRFEERRRFGEIAILNVIGLFDRPATVAAIDALLAETDLAPFTHEFDRVGGETWDSCVDNLRDMGLLNDPMPSMPGTIDAHPLVREHFRNRLQRRHPQGWVHGNRILYDHYRQLAQEQPETRDGMQLLYSAVGHGCAAGLHQEVFDNVLLPRIWWDRRRNYSTRMLGMTGSDLAALSNFFAVRWTHLKDVDVRPSARVLIRTNAGVRLRQLGRISDARGCFTAVVSEIDASHADAEEFESASYAAAQNSELLVIAGRLKGKKGAPDTALVSAARAVEYADRGSDPYFRMHARSTLAEVHFMLGELDEAGRLFDEAQQIEREQRPHPPFLYSQSLFRYGYYLIERGNAGEIVEAAAKNKHWGEGGPRGGESSRLSRAIKSLTLGAARRALIEAGETAPEFVRGTASILEEAIKEFQEAGYADYTVRGRTEMIHFLRCQKTHLDHQQAFAQRNDALFEANRGQMRLLKVDVDLQWAAFEVEFLPRRSPRERSAMMPTLVNAIDKLAEAVKGLHYCRRSAMVEWLRRRVREPMSEIRIEDEQSPSGDGGRGADVT